MATGTQGRGRGRAPAKPMPGGNAVAGGTPAPMPGRGRRGRGGKPALGNAAPTTPGGRQLQAKVQAGSLTSTQAKRTTQQRQTLAKALGPDWRSKLTVGGESFAQVNKQLKANPKNAKLAAIRKKLVTNRSKVLTAARAKNAGGKTKGAGE